MSAIFTKDCVAIIAHGVVKRDNKKAGSVKAPFFLKNDSDKPASLSHTNAH